MRLEPENNSLITRPTELTVAVWGLLAVGIKMLDSAEGVGVKAFLRIIFNRDHPQGCKL